MKKEILLPILLLVGLLGTLVGVYLKITHRAGAYPWLMVGLGASLGFWFAALYDVIQARKLDGIERLLWFIGLLAAPWLTGLLYFFAWRQGRFAR